MNDSTGKKVTVLDGDTIKKDGKSYRLGDIDTPESYLGSGKAERFAANGIDLVRMQEAGQIAKKELTKILPDYHDFSIGNTDKYDRPIAYNQELAEHMVGEGYAPHITNFNKVATINDYKLSILEQNARAKKAGLYGTHPDIMDAMNKQDDLFMKPFGTPQHIVDNYSVNAFGGDTDSTFNPTREIQQAEASGMDLTVDPESDRSWAKAFASGAINTASKLAEFAGFVVEIEGKMLKNYEKGFDYLTGNYEKNLKAGEYYKANFLEAFGKKVQEQQQDWRNSGQWDKLIGYDDYNVRKTLKDFADNVEDGNYFDALLSLVQTGSIELTFNSIPEMVVMANPLGLGTIMAANINKNLNTLNANNQKRGKESTVGEKATSVSLSILGTLLDRAGDKAVTSSIVPLLTKTLNKVDSTVAKAFINGNKSKLAKAGVTIAKSGGKLVANFGGRTAIEGTTEATQETLEGKASDAELMNFDLTSEEKRKATEAFGGGLGAGGTIAGGRAVLDSAKPAIEGTKNLLGMQADPSTTLDPTTNAGRRNIFYSDDKFEEVADPKSKEVFTKAITRYGLTLLADPREAVADGTFIKNHGKVDVNEIVKDTVSKIMKVNDISTENRKYAEGLMFENVASVINSTTKELSDKDLESIFSSLFEASNYSDVAQEKIEEIYKDRLRDQLSEFIEKNRDIIGTDKIDIDTKDVGIFKKFIGTVKSLNDKLGSETILDDEINAINKFIKNPPTGEGKTAEDVSKEIETLGFIFGGKAYKSIKQHVSDITEDIDTGTDLVNNNRNVEKLEEFAASRGANKLILTSQDKETSKVHFKNANMINSFLASEIKDSKAILEAIKDLADKANNKSVPEEARARFASMTDSLSDSISQMEGYQADAKTVIRAKKNKANNASELERKFINRLAEDIGFQGNTNIEIIPTERKKAVTAYVPEEEQTLFVEEPTGTGEVATTAPSTDNFPESVLDTDEKTKDTKTEDKGAQTKSSATNKPVVDKSPIREIATDKKESKSDVRSTSKSEASTAFEKSKIKLESKLEKAQENIKSARALANKETPGSVSEIKAKIKTVLDIIIKTRTTKPTKKNIEKLISTVDSKLELLKDITALLKDKKSTEKGTVPKESEAMLKGSEDIPDADEIVDSIDNSVFEMDLLLKNSKSKEIAKKKAAQNVVDRLGKKVKHHKPIISMLTGTAEDINTVIATFNKNEVGTEIYREAVTKLIKLDKKVKQFEELRDNYPARYEALAKIEESGTDIPFKPSTKEESVVERIAKLGNFDGIFTIFKNKKFKKDKFIEKRNSLLELMPNVVKNKLKEKPQIIESAMETVNRFINARIDNNGNYIHIPKQLDNTNNPLANWFDKINEDTKLRSMFDDALTMAGIVGLDKMLSVSSMSASELNTFAKSSFNDATDSNVDFIVDVLRKGTYVPIAPFVNELGTRVFDEMRFALDKTARNVQRNEIVSALGQLVVERMKKRYVVNKKTEEGIDKSPYGVSVNSFTIGIDEKSGQYRMKQVKYEEGRKAGTILIDLRGPRSVAKEIINTATVLEYAGPQSNGMINFEPTKIPYGKKARKANTAMPSNAVDYINRNNSHELRFSEDFKNMYDSAVKASKQMRKSVNELMYIIILGSEHDIIKNTNIHEIESTMAKYEAEKLEIDRLLLAYELVGDTTTPFFVDWDYTVSGRYMIDNRMVNTQNSKISRFIVSTKDQTKTFTGKDEVLDTTQLNVIRAAIAQAFDFDIDKDPDAKVFEDLAKDLIGVSDDGEVKIADTNLKKALAFYGKGMLGRAIIELRKIDDVNSGNIIHAFQTLGVIEALQNKNYEFASNLAIEIDAITNGMMLTSAELFTEGAKGFLEKGGFYFADENGEFKYKNHGEFLVDGGLDIYSTPIDSFLKGLDGVGDRKINNVIDGEYITVHKITSEDTTEIKNLMNELLKDKWRKFLKPLVMVFIYGAGMQRIGDEAGIVVANMIATKMMKDSKGTEKLRALLYKAAVYNVKVSNLKGRVDAKLSEEDMKKVNGLTAIKRATYDKNRGTLVDNPKGTLYLGSRQISILASYITANIGDSLSLSFNDSFKEITSYRRTLKLIETLNYKVFKNEFKNKLNSLMESKGKNITDDMIEVTEDEMSAIFSEMQKEGTYYGAIDSNGAWQDYFKEDTDMNVAQKNLSTAAKAIDKIPDIDFTEDRKESVMAELRTKIGDTRNSNYVEVTGFRARAANNSTSTKTVNSPVKVPISNVGAIGVTAIHNKDGSSMLKGHISEVVNIFDALVMGLDKNTNIAQAESMNKAMLDVSLSHNILGEALNRLALNIRKGRLNKKTKLTREAWQPDLSTLADLQRIYEKDFESNNDIDSIEISKSLVKNSIDLLRATYKAREKLKGAKVLVNHYYVTDEFKGYEHTIKDSEVVNIDPEDIKTFGTIRNKIIDFMENARKLPAEMSETASKLDQFINNC